VERIAPRPSLFFDDPFRPALIEMVSHKESDRNTRPKKGRSVVRSLIPEPRALRGSLSTAHRT
jgi:hypothetical protein